MLLKRKLAASVAVSLILCDAAIADIARDSDGDVISALHLILEYGGAARDANDFSATSTQSSQVGINDSYHPPSHGDSLASDANGLLRATGPASSNIYNRPDAVGRRVNPEPFGFD
ncbi:hypothetical protein [Phaeobacter gallaeciensis]|uniref:hypothetical protein n=1 Tax=Phaeobacter gallaeciensis TaxID=60890 RepID=UPI00237F7613|nr:hypothetical protein [Phaeobacter gallaeciensis]MDE4142950.1 hypothetical protein [Phaeobacter gallaeciensis]MDE4264285.1 hypothetical protein [Phaeobacter gallaeciensis]MDE4272648.1 hypothetical protein [Phaeobacter gallaeciensis]MDE4281035.1 hypothetical protein [Phaeobacter gallaeciensis]MDE4289385.1 hypothetical protein [Phaeobacter gallaeciensis]